MQDYDLTPGRRFTFLLNQNTPQAIAWVNGGNQAPQVSGSVKFYETIYGGVLVEAEIFGLPNIQIPGSTNFYAMHIHEGGDCSHNFIHTGGHYGGETSLHPAHAGDLLPLLGNQGYAWLSFYDKRFTINEILGRTVIIHAHPDDFTSQPSGNSGEKIACGVIRRTTVV